MIEYNGHSWEITRSYGDSPGANVYIVPNNKMIGCCINCKLEFSCYGSELKSIVAGFFYRNNNIDELQSMPSIKNIIISCSEQKLMGLLK